MNIIIEMNGLVIPSVERGIWRAGVTRNVGVEMSRPSRNGLAPTQPPEPSLTLGMTNRALIGRQSEDFANA
jgi:hypothetical protein